MKDRAMQALYQQTLAPVAETQADKISFGFRENRSRANAMQFAFLRLSRKTSPQWVVEGHMKGCFDNINHQWLLDHVPMDSEILSKFLKADCSYENRLFPTTQGAAQGGVISPTLAKRGLRLSETKTKITHITDGFDFLG